MLYTKLFLQVFLVHGIFTLGIHCKSCKEDYELSITCKSFEDLFKYPNPEKQEYLTVSSGENSSVVEPFICDEPMFQKFTAATYVALNNARVLHISPECFMGMDAVKAIELQNNELTSIDMETFRTSDEMQLRAIFLSNNHIIKLDFSTVTLPEVTQFEAYYNRLKFIKLKNGNLPQIANMYLGYNHIENFQIESQTMGKLDLSYNRIKTFRGINLVLPNLHLIYLNDNGITTMTPDMLENMPKLENIYLAHNLLQIVSFPPLKETNYIDLRYNRIKTIDSVNLTTIGQDYQLLFDSNKIFQMEGQTVFENLISFTCDSCYIHIIEPYFFAHTFKKLDQLVLTSNFLRSANIFQAYDEDLKLTSVSLSYNKINKINKKDFSRLSQVVALMLSNNEIATVAKGSFDTMQKLESLDITNNILFQLPGNLFDKTVSLQILSLSGNNMAFFNIPGWQEGTEEFTSSNSPLTKLNSLHMNKNPLQCHCVKLIRSWAKKNKVHLQIDDEKVHKGLRPSCIVNDHGCKDVGKDFVRDYWHLFNDDKVNKIFGDEDEDEEK